MFGTIPFSAHQVFTGSPLDRQAQTRSAQIARLFCLVMACSDFSINNTPIFAASLIQWTEVEESFCNSMRVDDTCCQSGSIISDYCLLFNPPTEFTLTLQHTKNEGGFGQLRVDIFSIFRGRQDRTAPARCRSPPPCRFSSGYSIPLYQFRLQIDSARLNQRFLKNRLAGAQSHIQQ